MIIADILCLSAMGILMLVALLRGATSVSRQELWARPADPRPAYAPRVDARFNGHGRAIAPTAIVDIAQHAPAA